MSCDQESSKLWGEAFRMRVCCRRQSPQSLVKRRLGLEFPDGQPIHQLATPRQCEVCLPHFSLNIRAALPLISLVDNWGHSGIMSWGCLMGLEALPQDCLLTWLTNWC